MKQKLQLILFAIALIFLQIATTYAQTQTFQWVKSWNGDTLAAHIFNNYIATDVFNNVYTAGNFTDTANFQPGNDTFRLISNGKRDMYISKLDDAGNLIWAKQIGSVNDYESLTGITTDSSGNVYSVGQFSNTIDFDPGPNTFNLTSNIYEALFILKLNASGEFVWAKKIGGPGSGQFTDIKVDNWGNVYTTGTFFDTYDFDPGSSIFNLNGGANGDVFVLKLDESGNFVWAKKIGGQSVDYSGAISLDASENVCVVGGFSSSVDFDPSNLTYNLTTGDPNNLDVFVLKLNSTGDFLWAKQIGGTWTDMATSITSAPQGCMNIVGEFSNTVDFNPGLDSFNLNSNNSQGLFILKLDSIGNFIWAKQMEGLYALSVITDVSGNVYTSKSITGYTNSAFWSAFVVSKFDNLGNFIWEKNIYDDAGGINLVKMSKDALDNLYLTGYFGGTVDFDPDTSLFNLTAPSVIGFGDVFVLKLGQPSTTAINEPIVDLSSVTLYPNPNAGSFTISAIEEGEYTVVNELGQAVRHFKLNNSNNYTATIENLSNGIYFVTGNSNNNVVRQKIVVTK
jgi:hypothetical protein